MTRFANRPNTALLIIDVQNGVVAGNYERDTVIANIALLLAQARRENAAVMWIQHDDAELMRGTDAWQIVPELVVGEGESVIEKHYRDFFEDTRLESVLAQLQVGRLIVTGAATDFCEPR